MKNSLEEAWIDMLDKCIAEPMIEGALADDAHLLLCRGLKCDVAAPGRQWPSPVDGPGGICGGCGAMSRALILAAKSSGWTALGFALAWWLFVDRGNLP